ncbi:hypothetical protein [Metallosphaera hakonensis]|uniref:Uncharacterized protein n=1 Tax=Metallosphaera hakonensis JCM 8857 = DSM 7519 TaxID=1293036 RepID=A0A2U9IRW4_9CREN|nr:hypothetical protein [Metallosphaera hakonensis]AWR98779.1 hypothetical protein DFR87_02710 [Metallosphaera hakonensis JCM 8857 = DSM 7519]
MRTLHVFPLPQGEGEERDLAILKYLGNKFNLGELNYYDLVEGKYSYLYGQFKRGKVIVKHDGKIGLALIKPRRKAEVKRDF